VAEGEKNQLGRPEAWRVAKGLIIAHRSRLALGAFLVLISRLAGLILPASSKYIIDEVVVKGRSELLVPIALIAGTATLLQGVTSFLLSQILILAGERAIIEMRKKVQSHVERLPIRYFDSTQTGKLIARVMNDAEGVRNLVGSGLVHLSGSIVTALISTGILFYLNWRLTALTIIALAGFGGGLAFAFKRLRPIFRERGEIYSQVTGRLAESLGGIRIVKAYTAERREDLAFARGMHRLFRNIQKSITGVSVVNAFSSVIIGAVGMVMIIVGGSAVLSGQMTLGDLFMYIFFTGMMAAPVSEIVGIGPQITQAFAGLDRIRELLNMPTEDEDDPSKVSINVIEGEVEFENVWFEYNSGVLVLKNISFKAPAGSTTALVGPSGSGKSTLISLVMNFNSPLSGRVKIDGHDLSTIRLSDYRSHLGIVLQDNFLFDGTIAENISFSKPHASREEIQAVSRVAHCEEFIEGFDEKYDTIVGERGVKLSGGQRQRIAIARALLANPKILILDEATSNLDSESEALIQEGLRALRQGRTTFVIAHRLSTIRNADQILVLQAGEIVERGTHESLLVAGGRYRQLYDKQYKFERDQFINPHGIGTLELAKVEIESETPVPQVVPSHTRQAERKQDRENRPHTKARIHKLTARFRTPHPINYLPEENTLMIMSRKKKIITSIVMAALLMLTAILVAGVFARRNDHIEVQTAKIERRALLESKVTANGEVRPIDYADLTAEVPGRVTDVYVKEGEVVKKGAPLLRVDPTQLAATSSMQEAALRASQAETQNQEAALAAAENAVNTARAQLNTSKADLDKATVEKNNAEIELKRAADLLEAGIQSRSFYDTSKMRFDSAAASVDAAKARVQQSEVQVRDAEIRVKQAGATLNSSKARVAQQQAGLDQAADQLKKTTQYAPIDGVVAGPIVKEGTFALANFSTTPLLLIADMSVVDIWVRVDETDIANVAIGQKAKVKVDALGDKEIEGEIVESAAWAQNRAGQTTAQAAASANQEAKDFKVVVRLTNLTDEVRERLRPGMSATAVITTDRRENVIAVPLQALVERDPQEIGQGGANPAGQNQAQNPKEQNPKDKKPVKGVFIIENDKSVFVPVETGITGENDIEIKSGLKEGQEIVTGPYRELRTLNNEQQVKREDMGKK
jgi:ABC-type multidrug transport system fused ATPase/permease subunit/multidrug resistance efflux pump